MAQMEAYERSSVIEWFETDFKETAKRTTQTARLEDGKVSYKFSAVNNSGIDFSSFSFRVKILDKATGREIGTSTIKTGEWQQGETKIFKSRISIPDDVRSISFVMFSESVQYEEMPASAAVQRREDVYRSQGMAGEITEALDELGDFVNGEGGLFGELFGTGGMPETTVTKTTTTRTPSGTTTKTTTTTRTSSQSGRQQSRPQSRKTQPSPMQSYTIRKNNKRLNKMRLGKAPGAVVSGCFAALLAIAAMAESNTPEQTVGYVCMAAVLAIAAAGIKFFKNRKGKLIRAYETKVNFNGNTSIDELAEYVGRSPEKVADDLQKMIVDGFFPNAYIDINNRLLVMTKNGVPIEDPEKSAAANQRAKRKAARERGVVPESIEDMITMTDDAQIKAKLKELRTITKKIDLRIQEKPELENQVKEFREKYYPEVVRLTDEYNEKIARLESYVSPELKETEFDANPNYLQEQARDIKDQLIKLIDSVTEASENLLEKLHEDDIMDITTDIQSLQATLASKGLLDSDFDLR